MAERKPLKLIRLINNNDLVAHVVEDKETEIVVSDALVVYIDSNVESMTQMVYMYPWLSIGVAANSKSSVAISRNHIAYITDVHEEMYEYHKNMWEVFSLEEEERKEKPKKTASGEKVVSIHTKNPLVH